MSESHNLSMPRTANAAANNAKFHVISASPMFMRSVRYALRHRRRATAFLTAVMMGLSGQGGAPVECRVPARTPPARSSTPTPRDPTDFNLHEIGNSPDSYAYWVGDDPAH